MKLTLKPAKLTDDQLFGVIQIKAHPHGYVLNIEVDKKGYDNMIGCEPNNFLATLTVIHEKLPHLLNAYDTSIITNFITTVGVYSHITMRVKTHPSVEEKQKIFKSPSTTPDPDRELTVLFNDGDILNKITWKNNKLRIDSNEIRGIVFFEKIKAWAYTDELLQAHNISLPEKETKAEPEAKAAPEPETSTAEPSTDDEMSNTEKMAAVIPESFWDAMYKKEETPLTLAQQYAISTIDSLIANLLTMTPTEVREITKYLKQKLAEQQNS